MTSSCSGPVACLHYIDERPNLNPTNWQRFFATSVQVLSTRVGHLVKQAMTHFDTDRRAAWRCLSDASTLLGTDVGHSGHDAPGAKNVEPGGLASWQARRTLAHIEANLASRLEIDALATGVGLSRSHFSRVFKRSVGLSPMEYVAVRRLERAKVMISSTREPLADVALVCGFADQAHLSRRLRDFLGMSPGRWRRSNRALSTGGHCDE
jgi:AraC family transcriptional regulator